MQKFVLNALSRKLLSGDLDKEKPIWVDVKKDELLFRHE